MLDALDKTINKDAVLLLARVLMMVLFVLFGAQKLMEFGATESYFASLGLPLPKLATCLSIFVELGLGIAVLLGFLTRPLALLFAVYTVATGLIGHTYWDLSGAAQVAAEINFYKNVSIAGGFLLLYLTGAGKYSLDALAHRERSDGEFMART